MKQKNEIDLTFDIPRTEIREVAPVARQAGLHPCFLHLYRLAGVDNSLSSISSGGETIETLQIMELQPCCPQDRTRKSQQQQQQQQQIFPQVRGRCGPRFTLPSGAPTRCEAG